MHNDRVCECGASGEAVLNRIKIPPLIHLNPPLLYLYLPYQLAGIFNQEKRGYKYCVCFKGQVYMVM